MKKFIIIELPESDLCIPVQFTTIEDGELHFIAVDNIDTAFNKVTGSRLTTRVQYTITKLGLAPLGLEPSAQAHRTTLAEFVERFPENIQHETIKLFVESIPDLKAVFEGVLRDFKVTQSGDDTPTDKIDYYKNIDVATPETGEVIARNIDYKNVKMLNRALKYYGFEIVSELKW